ncbi:MAG: trehalase family glycosidase [bacterium]
MKRKTKPQAAFEAQAFALLQRNTQTIRRSGREYRFSIPSIGTYPFQWFWDSCFHAIAWSHTDPARAQDELRALCAGQEQSGFLPHMIYWDQKSIHRSPLLAHWQESRGWFTFLPGVAKPKTSALIQPPVLAQAVERVFMAQREKAFLREMLPHLDRYYAWLLAKRDPDRDHLISIVSQYESGLDASPAYDELIAPRLHFSLPEYLVRSRAVPFLNKLLYGNHNALTVRFGRFHVEDVLVNSILGLNLHVLALLHDVLGETQAGTGWRTASKEVFAAIIKKMWDPQRRAFFNLNGRGERRSTILTIASLFPLLCPWLPKTYVCALVEHLKNPKEFWLTYPVPSVAATEPTFSPESRLPNAPRPSHWRGSTWMNTNWFLVHALRQHGYHEEADHIAKRSRELVALSGFREYYNPITGAGIAAKEFGWSTLVVDL